MSKINEMIENLNAQKITSELGATQRPHLHALEIVEVLASTNTHLLRKAVQDAPSGSVCLAEEQTAGRGRLGRVWYSPRASNLYMSVLWHFPVQSQPLSSLSLAVGVMVWRTLQAYGCTEARLKWPNDIEARACKLGGILIESVPARAGVLPVVIGMGLNVCLGTEDLPQEAKQWMDLSRLSAAPIQRNRLCGMLLDQVLAGLVRFSAEGFAAFQADWSKADSLYQKPVRVFVGDVQYEGIALGVDSAGKLVLQTATGVQSFVCGEVSVRLC